MQKYVLNNMEAWRFTENEKNQLRKTLKKYESGRVDGFINALEFLCLRMKYIQDRVGNLDRQVVKLDRKRILNSLKKAFIELKKLESHSYIINCGPSYADDLTKKSIKNIFDRWSTVNDTIKNLEKIISLVEDTQLPVSKIDRNKFVSAIHDLFWKYLDKPTTYEDGPFTLVVRICLNVVGITIDDVSRHIKAACKNPS